MPDLEPAMQLAVELDCFAYHYDAFQHDSGFDSMDDSIPLVYDMLKDGYTEDLEKWLNEVISEEATPEDEERAKELLAKLAEYKPLVYQNISMALVVKFACLALGAVGIANMYLAIFADVGVMILAVLNAIRCLFVKKL